jgi:hypothetical protein
VHRLPSLVHDHHGLTLLVHGQHGLPSLVHGHHGLPLLVALVRSIGPIQVFGDTTCCSTTYLDALQN